MRIIGHLDMDAFFASIEERDNPRLRGKPIVVGADPEGGRGRGVVSTANYKAREYGIRSALPIAAAWRFSEEARRKGLPPAAFLEVRGVKYGEVSRRIMGILRAHAPQVEEASVDEAYFDLSSTGSYETAREVAVKIKKEIKEKEKLTASIGIGPNKLIAKIASDRQKPDGLTVVREVEAEAFLAPLPIRTLPGVGPKTEERFRALGVRTVLDARRFSEAELVEMMGKWGASLYWRLRGRDESPLVSEWVAKSVGEQTTFPHDIPVGAARERKMLEAALSALAEDVYQRFLADVRRGDFKSFRGITLTVRFADFQTITRSVTLPTPVSVEAGAATRSAVAGAGSVAAAALATLKFQALRLFMPFMDRRENPEHKAIRLIGIRVEKLE